MNNRLKYLLFLIVVLFCSCRVTKYVPQDQFLLDKVRIKADRKEIKTDLLENYVKQKPNFRILTLFRTSLHIYNMSGRDSSKWLNRVLRKAGNPPVIFDEELTKKSREDLEKAVLNQGYLNVTVAANVVKRKKKAFVEYRINAREPYRVRQITHEIGNNTVALLVKKDTVNSLLKRGVLFDRALLEQERQRIVSMLRRNGYYGVSKEMISYVADSSLNSNQLDLEVRLFPASESENIEKLPLEQSRFHIKNIYMQLEGDPQSVDSVRIASDTIVHKGYRIVHGNNCWIRPEVLTSSCYIVPGRLYNERMVELTYNSFSRLKAVKYVTIRFEPVSHADSSQLNCFLALSPAKTQSVSTEVEGTNSAGDFGAAVSVTYQHRNIFHGSETFSAKVRGAYERLTGAGINSNFTEFSTEVGLAFPKFLFPFLDTELKRRVRATSELLGSYNFQQRPEYTRVIGGGGWRYKWTSSRGAFRHNLDFIDVNYVYLPWKSADFFASVADYPLLKYSYENHLITRTGYTFNLTNQSALSAKTNLYSLRIGVEGAGNTLYGLSKLFKANKTEGQQYQFLGVSFAQYAKADVDYAQTKILDERNSLAWHAALGVACPYGNSQILPFEKRYFAGGANSVRGWSVRTLGPGIFKRSGTTADYLNQSGDIKLDLSMEYRAKLFGPVETALFVDAGNIWTIRDYLSQAGGVFRINEFYKQIAFAYGIGLMRLNFSYFIIRVDLGVKAYDPSRDGKDKWRIWSPTMNDLALHFAVGYPF